MLRRVTLIDGATVLALVLAGCRAQREQFVQPLTLEGTEWVLISLRDSRTAEGAPITLSFHPGNYLEGRAGCNSYGGNYVVEGQAFSIPRLHRTEFDCREDDVLQQEAAYLEALQTAALHGMADAHLEFRDADGETLLTFSAKQLPPVDADLADTEWALESLPVGAALLGSGITLSLGREGFGGFTGCNRYGGEYAAADQSALVLASLWYTEAECRTSALQVQERAYLEALSGAATYRLIEERLEIGGADGEASLVFARRQGVQPASK